MPDIEFPRLKIEFPRLDRGIQESCYIVDPAVKPRDDGNMDSRDAGIRTAGTREYG
jgi:hypothetical protein